jgi:hypothetical protein
MITSEERKQLRRQENSRAGTEPLAAGCRRPAYSEFDSLGYWPAERLRYESFWQMRKVVSYSVSSQFIEKHDYVLSDD